MFLPCIHHHFTSPWFFLSRHPRPVSPAFLRPGVSEALFQRAVIACLMNADHNHLHSTLHFLGQAKEAHLTGSTPHTCQRANLSFYMTIHQCSCTDLDPKGSGSALAPGPCFEHRTRSGRVVARASALGARPLPWDFAPQCSIDVATSCLSLR